MSWTKPPLPLHEQARALLHEMENERDAARCTQLAQEALTCIDVVREYLVQERLTGVKQLRDVENMSLSQLGSLLNVSKSRAQQLVDATRKDPRSEDATPTFRAEPVRKRPATRAVDATSGRRGKPGPAPRQRSMSFTDDLPTAD